jgi:hypothetical protein
MGACPGQLPKLPLPIAGIQKRGANSSSTLKAFIVFAACLRVITERFLIKFEGVERNSICVSVMNKIKPASAQDKKAEQIRCSGSKMSSTFCSDVLCMLPQMSCAYCLAGTMSDKTFQLRKPVRKLSFEAAVMCLDDTDILSIPSDAKVVICSAPSHQLGQDMDASLVTENGG